MSLLIDSCILLLERERIDLRSSGASFPFDVLVGTNWFLLCGLSVHYFIFFFGGCVCVCVLRERAAPKIESNVLF